MNKNPTAPIIPTPLNELIKELIGYKEYAEFKYSSTLPQLIELYDTNSEYCHVEWPSKDNPIPHPRLYTKATWMACSERIERIKAEAEQCRSINAERNEAWTIIFNKILDIMMLNPKNVKHHRRVSDLTIKLMESKAKGLTDFLGIDISNLPDSPYKNLKKIK